jgi:DNA-directed RNA polymerase specialized sigma24 family protein
MALRAKKNYINNKTFYEEMVKYKEACKQAEADGKQLPQIPRYIGECLSQICKKLSTKPNFMNYSYREEMVGDGIENCVSAVHNFDPTKSTNPFAYFTQIAWNAFIRRIQSEKKQTYIKHKNYQNSFLMDAYGEGVSMNTNEYADDVIRNFEDKLKLTKENKKVKIENVDENSANH